MMGFLLLIGIVVTNAIVLITFVEQLRERGLGVYDALVTGGRVRIRPILMTAFHHHLCPVPLALSGDAGGGIIGGRAGYGSHRRADQFNSLDSDRSSYYVYLYAQHYPRHPVGRQILLAEGPAGGRWRKGHALNLVS